MLQTTLISLETSRGAFDKAVELFNTLDTTCIVSLTSMVHNFGQSRKWEELKALHHRVMSFGVKPNTVYFTGLCQFTQSLEELKTYFKQMDQLQLTMDFVFFEKLFHSQSIPLALDDLTYYDFLAFLLTRMRKLQLAPSPAMYLQLFIAAGKSRNLAFLDHLLAMKSEGFELNNAMANSIISGLYNCRHQLIPEEKKPVMELVLKMPLKLEQFEELENIAFKVHKRAIQTKLANPQHRIFKHTRIDAYTQNELLFQKSS